MEDKIKIKINKNVAAEINPSTALVCKVSGLKSALEQSIFRYYNGSVFDTVHFDDKKKVKRERFFPPVVTWLVPRESAALSAHVLCTPYNHAPVSLHSKPHT